MDDETIDVLDLKTQFKILVINNLKLNILNYYILSPLARTPAS